jgi:Osmosensitive K+ channel histidine kinase
MKRNPKAWSLRQALIPGAACLALVAAGELLSPLVGLRSVDLLFLAAVLGLSLVSRPLIAAFTAILSALALNYLSMPPVHSLAIVAGDDWALFVVYILVAVVTGTLVSRLRLREAQLAEESEAKRKALVQLESERLGSILLDSVSHELRTPLTAVTGSLSALASEDVAANAEARRELVANALGASDQLGTVVDDLLSLSRLEAGAVRISRRLCDAEELAQAAAERAGPELAGHTLRVATGDLSRSAFVDLALVARLGANLLRNAARYSPALEPIDLKVEVGEGVLVVAVSDRGSGLPEEELVSVFEKFHRGRTASSEGLGLGLAICKGIARAHGGAIKARNMPGGGLEITASLPFVLPRATEAHIHA